MDRPSQLFSRIRRQKARPALPRQGSEAVRPAPVPPNPAPASPAAIPSPIPPASAAAIPPEPSVPAATQPPAPARPARGHALYSQVMRSHDRMGTRHL